jgi:hypothetical protein
VISLNLVLAGLRLGLKNRQVAGQIVVTDFRAGNVSPNTDNLGFIKTCQDALPKGTNIKKT